MTVVDISPEKDNGVLKEIIKEGVGDELPSSGCQVTVHYIGTLTDGTKFDSSKDRNQPFTFYIGRASLIKAWNIGVITMKKGEIAMFTCAPAYAYGKIGNLPNVPPDATLKFEIEMIDWKGEDLSPKRDGSILRYIIVAGKSLTSPGYGALVSVRLVGKYNGQVFDDRKLKFYMGEGENCGVVDGVETALSSFKRGETSRLVIKSKHAFRNIGNKQFNIPPNADVEYTVKLKKFESSVDIWTLSGPEMIKQAEMFKEKGTLYLKQGRYSLAIKVYKQLQEYLKRDVMFPDNKKLRKRGESLLLTCNLNLALSYLKNNQNVEAKDSCDQALKIDPANEKALFRRGQAYLGLASPEIAIKDFQEVLVIEPKNTAASKQILVANNMIKQEIAKEKKLYANMFEKFAREDKQREEEKLRQQPDVMRGALGEWGQEERPGGRNATAFEKENPNILMLNANGTGEFQNM